VFAKRMRPTARSGRTRSYRLQVLIAARAFASLLLFLSASLLLDLESNFNSESILEAPMASVHRRFACMGCTARSNGRGHPTYFNDYQSAATHYSRSSICNKSMRGIKTVAVQLNTRPQYVGDGEAGGGGAAGAWRPQAAPSRRAGTMITAMKT
jgi:hypothetical protein